MESSSLAALSSAVARTSPFLTCCPITAATVTTGQTVLVLAPELDETADVVSAEATMSGPAPKRRPYVVVAETVPLAVTLAVTVPTAAAWVVYLEDEPAASIGPNTTSIGAAMPTASSPAAAMVPRFIRCPPPSLTGRLKPGAAARRCYGPVI